MKNINLDYDGTFTSDPNFWTAFIHAAQLSGYKIFCISQRTDNWPNKEELRKAFPASVSIFLTNHNPKKEWAERRGIEIDIWIENNPLAIFESDCPTKQISDDYMQAMQKI